ncbi:MAG: thioredoxin domain-containing protein [Pirellulales bacterium]
MQRFTAATCAVALLVISAALVHGQADVPPVPGQNNTTAGGPVLLDFTADWCGYCRQMEPVLDQLRQAGYAIRTVDVDRQPQIAQQFRAHSLPCFVMVVNGQEVDRVVGATSGQRLAQMFAAAKQLAPQSAAPAVSPTHPDASPRTGGPPATFAQTSGPTQPPVAQLAVSKSHEPFRPSADATSSPRGDASAGVPSTFAPSTQDLAAAAPAVAPSVASIPGSESEPPLVSAAEGVDIASVPRSVIDRALAASVRLRVEDSDGRSWGSGTIVDVSAGRALIVTCAHIFRESAGDAPVTIDLFGDDTPKGLTGKVVSYDLPSDVAARQLRRTGRRALRESGTGHAHHQRASAGRQRRLRPRHDAHGDCFPRRLTRSLSGAAQPASGRSAHSRTQRWRFVLGRRADDRCLQRGRPPGRPGIVCRTGRDPRRTRSRRTWRRLRAGVGDDGTLLASARLVAV